MEMFFAAVKEMDPSHALGAGFMLAGSFAFVGFLAFLEYLLTSVGYCKALQKAGLPGWKAFIPVYNSFVFFKLSWTGGMFFVNLALSVVFTALGTSESMGLLLVAAAAGIACIVIEIKQTIKMAKAFGKGAGFGVLLFLFPYIMAPVLGFGKAQFIGKK